MVSFLFALESGVLFSKKKSKFLNKMKSKNLSPVSKKTKLTNHSMKNKFDALNFFLI